jgi:hypothetical protein
MDGFFVAKFKVEKRKKPVRPEAEAEAVPQMKLNDDGELVEEKKTAFDDEEDKEIIQGEPVFPCLAPIVRHQLTSNRG